MPYGHVVTGATQTVSLTMNDIDAYDPYAVGRDRRLCPLCGNDKPRDDSHRSLWVNATQSGFYCHRCSTKGRIGDETNWLSTDEFKAKMQERRREEQEEDMRRIKKAQSMFKKTGQVYYAPCAEYLRSRGINPVVAGKLGVRWHPNWSGSGALVFAARCAKGYVTAAQGRYIDRNHQPRMHTIGKAKRGVFTTCKNVRCLPSTFAIVEAPLDAISYYSLFGVHAVATMGCWQQQWLVTLCNDRRVILATDNDKAGEQAALEWSKLLLAANIKQCRRKPDSQIGKDWNDVLRHSKGLI